MYRSPISVNFQHAVTGTILNCFLHMLLAIGLNFRHTYLQKTVGAAIVNSAYSCASVVEYVSVIVSGRRPLISSI